MTSSTLLPSLRFCYAEALHAKILNLLETLEQAEDPAKHRSALGDLVVELTNAGMDDYFVKPLQVSQGGFCGATDRESWRGRRDPDHGTDDP